MTICQLRRTPLALCLAVHCWHNWRRSRCSPHKRCTPCTGPASTCACLAGTSCSSPPSPLCRLPSPRPWLLPCSLLQKLRPKYSQNRMFLDGGSCVVGCSPFPAWFMAPVSLPHWPLLFTPNVHTSPFLVRTHVWALPIATWVTTWPFRSDTWPVIEADEREVNNNSQISRFSRNTLGKSFWELTGAVTVNSIFAKHVQLSILGDDAAAAVVACCVDSCFCLQLDHFLGLIRLGLSATFSWKRQQQRSDFNL